MKSIQSAIFGKDIPAVIAASVLVLAGVGAAAGVAASGTITGEASAEVKQSLLLGGETASLSGDAVKFTDSASGVIQVNEDGTSFTAGTTIQQGEDFGIKLDVDNTADESLSAELVVNVDQPLEISANENGIDIQRVGSNRFILTAQSNENGNTIELKFDSPNDIRPGFYNIQVELKPTEV